ncbi:MAG: hypothetical protein K0R44_28 [Thermomicrobiales bacterium]|jgi:hypothetical protein|nr:hypothetical protein [Thermomicrobiales bacterium]MDF3014803.1 hypothetical protein [Thermomicrobiales bacterium]
MFQLPEDLTSLDRAALSALLATLRSDFRTELSRKRGEDEGALDRSALQAEYTEARETVLSMIATFDEVDPADAPEPPAVPADDEVVDPPAAPEEEEVDPPVEPEPDDEAAVSTKPVVTTTGLATTPTNVAERRSEAEVFKALATVAGKKQGERFSSWAEAGAALMAMAADTRGSGMKHYVGSAAAQIPDIMKLDEGKGGMARIGDNLKLMEQDEVTAALCAPLPTVYGLACDNVTRRPVKGSLRTYQAPRGGVQIMSSPTLEDIKTGFGIWDRDDDANPAATKEACQTIKCNTPSSYYMYAVYRCMTVKNMLAATYPELVEAWLNRLQARWARMAEVQLLEAMAVDTTVVEAHTLGYNASTSIITNLLNYLALYQELQRWDVPSFEAWIPRWALYAIKADMMRRRRTDGSFAGVPSDAQVNALFTSVGVTPHWFIDTPSWATPIPKFQVTGRLGQFTRNLEILIAPTNKFAVIDRGELNFGVNNVMRDNTSLSKNEYTLFYENYEGIVNTTSCPAHVLEFNNLCFNGQQIADVVLNCEGYDEVGAAS